jgi:hypothetical protein
MPTQGIAILILSAAIIGQAYLAGAQQTEPTAAEKALAAQIKCEDLRHNSDGSWTSRPNAKVGNNVVPTITFSIRGFSFGGADVASVLNQKCGRR